MTREHPETVDTDRDAAAGDTATGTGRAETVTVQPTGVSAADVVAVARRDARVELDPATIEAMTRSRDIVEAIEVDGRPVYGVSTGFGALADTFISPDRRSELQHALIRSHAAGIGAPMPREVVRAMILLRVRSLALGRSGVRPLIAQALVDLLNHDVTPWVPEHGSLGASGDLAPLAHCALVLLGEGWVLDRDGTRVSGGAALARAGVRPIRLSAKEGLALINGTDGMLGMLLLAGDDAAHLFAMADLTAALSVEASRNCMPSGRIPGRRSRRRTSTGCSRTRPSWTVTATTWRTRCRTPTPCGARRRWPVRPGTRSTMCARWPAGS
jgi:histidine ammonia-lyase